jgi:hypothetical protein
VHFSFSGPVVLAKKIFKLLPLYKHMQKQFFVLGPQPTPMGHDSNKLPFVLYNKEERFHVDFSSSDVVILEKILKIFVLYKQMSKQSPLLWPHPTPPPGDNFKKLAFLPCQIAFM